MVEVLLKSALGVKLFQELGGAGQEHKKSPQKTIKNLSLRFLKVLGSECV